LDALRGLGDELTQRQKTFDDTLKTFLGKDQWKRYDKWRSDERKRPNGSGGSGGDKVPAARSRPEWPSVSAVTAAGARRVRLSPVS